MFLVLAQPAVDVKTLTVRGVPPSLVGMGQVSFLERYGAGRNVTE
jgi:hypothetical protein